jgi:anti-sigma factor RsiW
MVTGTHPEDSDLFDYIEGDLPAPRHAELEVHLASCAQCAEQIARVQAGRDALRESQLLRLPPRRRDAILLNLPAQRRAAPRSWGLSPKRLVAVLTPVAAVVAVAVALVSTGDNREESQAGGAFTSQEAAPVTTAPAEAAGGGAETQEDKATRLLSVAGPADVVAAQLRSEGFDARAVGRRVEVRNATRAEVERALQGRRDGRVRIVIVR